MEAVTTVGTTVSYLKQKKTDMSYIWNMHYYTKHCATNFGLYSVTETKKCLLSRNSNAEYQTSI